MNDQLIIRQLGLCHYQDIWQQMQDFTNLRRDKTSAYNDQLWLVEHHPVFTQGQAGKAEHILDAGNIPIIQSDRGGQVTYHGPGQIVAYLLVDLRRRHLSIRQLVSAIEQSVIHLLADLSIKAQTQPKAPGIYVDMAKICSLGLRVRHGCSYHGLALNVAMDMEPFKRINPCGFKQLAMTQITDYFDAVDFDKIYSLLIKHLGEQLGYNTVNFLEQETDHDNIS